jgi:hypothetical protein
MNSQDLDTIIRQTEAATRPIAEADDAALREAAFAPDPLTRADWMARLEALETRLVRVADALKNIG